MIGRYVALLRGINVGRAKRVAMEDLRELVEELGYAAVRTHANSGNVLFTAPGSDAGDAAQRIEAALAERLQVTSRVTVLSASELTAVVHDNPLLDLATDPSRLFVAFLAGIAEREKLLPLAARDWAPERLAIAARAAYVWCPAGMLQSRVMDAVGRALGDAVTTRNWNTVTRLLNLAR